MPLFDSFGRKHDNLRISVTDRCNLRCVYCMPEQVNFMEREELLYFEEITRFVRVASSLGITKLRLTGGEPLLRKHIHLLVEQLVQVPGIKDISLTTNGMLLADHITELANAGLHRVTISLDTLDPKIFRTLTRRDGLEKVIEGIEAVVQSNLKPVKVNAVIIRGINDHEVIPLAQWARELGVELRFIEYMPIGAEAWEREKCYFAHEIMDQLETGVGPLLPSDQYDPRNPAMEFDWADGKGSIGIIASVSRPFCRSCNRIRLTADGKLRNCLFALEEDDIKPLLRSSASDDEIVRVIERNVSVKWEGHEINTTRFVKPGRTMHAIGG